MSVYRDYKYPFKSGNLKILWKLIIETAVEFATHHHNFFYKKESVMRMQLLYRVQERASKQTFRKTLRR